MAPPISSLSSLVASSQIPTPLLPKPSSRALAVAPCSSASSSASPSTSSTPSRHAAAPAASAGRRGLLALGAGFLSSAALLIPAGDAGATRVEYYATVGDQLCDLSLVKSGLAYCDVEVHYTARFPDGTLFDSSYKRGRPLTMRIGAGKILRGLEQGISGGGGVPPMLVGGKRKLMIPASLAYGPEPAGCFSGDCNIPGNATLLYDLYLVGIYKKFEIEFGYNHVVKLTFFFSELTIVLFSKIVNHLSEILLWQFFFPGTRGEFQGQVYPADEGVSCQDWW
ncbi:unnamed protein product [Miscanthus lutarioriparius]|uniref:peptidylprolyl isomerase n=1 Tax=Miscanthus lutarioriparius TaxID=422564 RepID=A0A811PI93_9POAL|nr:unnamed protein product [Miscanthus lutarioriparius]